MKNLLENKFWFVSKPNTESEFGDICWNTSLYGLFLQFKGGLTFDELAGMFTEQVPAEKMAKGLLKKRDKELKSKLNN